MRHMSASRLRFPAKAAVAVAMAISGSTVAYADGPSRFSPFSGSSNATPATPEAVEAEGSGSYSQPTVEVSKRGFDPEALERGAKALREINNSPMAKQVFEVMRKQEHTRLAELDAEKAHFSAIQAHADIEKQRKFAEDQRNLYQQQSQAKAQLLRYEDELARKRMQTDHEAQRRHNIELVQMQEESSNRTEHARRATEEQIQAQQRLTEKERAEIQRETTRVGEMAKAEARAHESRLTEEQNRRILLEQIRSEQEKWLAAINTTFNHISGGFQILMTDKSKMVMVVGASTALAAGIFATREGARVMWGYVNRILGQPSLIRESSMGKFPGIGVVTQAASKLLSSTTAAGPQASMHSKSALGDAILHPSLQKRVEHLARATANTKTNEAPFRNMLFYGPPGTGKTMVAREIARKSGLDYAMMTGGDVAPLGAQAVTKIHEIFDWAKKSKKGLLLFIDEADAFLCERNSIHMSEAQRSSLNALLFRTGDQSRDVAIVLATNRPGDLDSAVTDRIDEVIEFPLPQEEERFKLMKLYLKKYLSSEADDRRSTWGRLFRRKPQQVTTIKDLSDEVIRAAARRTEGFSGREIAKLMASVQATVYGRPDCVLDSGLFNEVVDYKVAEHHQRIKLAGETLEKKGE